MPGPGPMMGGPPPGGMKRRAEIPGMRPQRVDEEFDLSKIEEESREMMKMNFLNNDNCSFFESESGFLNVKAGDKEYRHVQIVRTFPYTAPFEYLSVRDGEGTSKEIGIIKDLELFDEETKSMINRQLEFRYFTPVIREILYTKMRAGIVSMKVRTDYGECRFSFRTNNNAVIKLGENRVFIQDMDNNRYEIPDAAKLTVKEQKKLDVLL